MARRVLAANRQFYDSVGGAYERLDGRRNERFALWLGLRMQRLRALSGGGRLLDLGCGAGVVMRAAAPFFEQVVGLDVSHAIASVVAQEQNRPVVCGEATALPFKSGSFDAIACFATLHHLYDPAAIMNEVFRVLAPGGVLYTDHDMTLAFSKRFGPFLKCYRTLFDAAKRYQQATPAITQDIYDLAEFHEAGIEHASLARSALRAGFKSADCAFHWYGLNGVLDHIIGQRQFGAGWAPLLSLTARK